MKLFVIDQSLIDYDGHHFEYDLAIANAAAALGLEPVVLAHRMFRELAPFSGRVVPWFSTSSYDSRRSPLARLALGVINRLPPKMRRVAVQLASALRRGSSQQARPAKNGAPPLVSFGAEAVRGLKAHGAGPGDHAFIHSFLNPELHALIAALATSQDLPQIHIVLRRDAEEEAVRHDAWGGIEAAIDAIRNAPGLSGRLHFYADTPGLAKQYNRLFGEDCVAVLPIPHCLPDNVQTAPKRGEALRLVYLGNARSEKGYDLLPQMVADLSDGFAAGRLHLVAQSNFPLSLDESNISAALRKLASFPPSWVELLHDPLGIEAFQDLLISADIVLLPYRADMYRNRSSGILVQAATMGKPVVVPADSWLAEAAPVGTAITFDKPEAFPKAVRTAIDRIETLSAAARAKAPEIAETNSASRLVEILIS